MENGGHRPACFEPHPDRAPLAELCDRCRDALTALMERRPLCAICEFSITKGELYYRTEIDAEPASLGVVVISICSACARNFADQSGFVGAIG